MHSPENSITEQERKLLLELARRSIEHGLRHDRRLEPQLHGYPEKLTALGAVFVTLRRKGALRGCIGSIAAYQPLVVDVCDKAYSAAFRDPRFEALGAEELPGLAIQISMLTPLAPMAFESEQDLLEQIRVNVDGLVIEVGGQKGTFLPSMWEQLPSKIDFWQHLKLKAGLPVSFWSEQLRAYRFETECFADEGYFLGPLG